MNQLDQVNPLTVGEACWQTVSLPDIGVVSTHMGHLQSLPIPDVAYNIDYMGVPICVTFGTQIDGITPMYHGSAMIPCLLKVAPKM